MTNPGIDREGSIHQKASILKTSENWTPVEGFCARRAQAADRRGLVIAELVEDALRAPRQRRVPQRERRSSVDEAPMNRVWAAYLIRRAPGNGRQQLSATRNPIDPPRDATVERLERYHKIGPHRPLGTLWPKRYHHHPRAIGIPVSIGLSGGEHTR